MPAQNQSVERPITEADCADTGAESLEYGRPPISRRHALLFGFTGLAYLLVVVAILCDSPLVDLDWTLQQLRPYYRWPDLLPYLDIWVVAGQRGPTAIAASLWLGWRCYRQRSARPLLVMGMALLLLNFTVGGVKIVTGRLGPHYAHYVGSPELFSGGTIFPSGHTANAVVTWGVLAYLATRWRRTGAVLAGLTATSIGLTTVYLGTHWISDVFAGWAAGLLVLLSLPLTEPALAAADARLTAIWRRGGTAPQPAPPRLRPVPVRLPAARPVVPVAAAVPVAVAQVVAVVPVVAVAPPAPAHAAVPARTVRPIRPDRYSLASAVPAAAGASTHTVRQPRPAAGAHARTSGSPR
ncbi:phosphatase PAP2 family protein [Kitasatospora sp. NPDC048365]|uniref:phosphatase PAP2 family protein n=1 Tax=Kitasatospora sp. NPDC048365 TaxID=3364050 RepID=UPI00371667C3